MIDLLPMTVNDDQHIHDQIERVAQLNMMGSLDEMSKEVESLLQNAQSLQHDEGIVAALLYRGFLYDYEALYDKSIETLKEVISLGMRLNLPDYCMRAHNSLGSTYSQKADFYTGLSYYLKAYHISADHPEYKYDCVVLNNIGNLFEWLGDYVTATDYLEQSYQKYYEGNVDDPSFLLLLIINLIDVYSYLENYEKVQELTEHNVPFGEIPDGEEVVACLKIMNRAVLCYRAGDQQGALDAIDEFLEQSAKTSDYSSIFRCLIHLLKVSIDLNDCEIIERLMARMDSMQSQTAYNTFDYQYSELRMEYYQRYLRTERSVGDDYIDNYVEESKRTIGELKQTYVNSLLVQLELDNSRLEAAKLRRDMQKDVFTDLYNKVGSEHLVRASLEQFKTGELHAFILIDIDNFKLINDFYGHHFGDEIILRTAVLLEESAFPHSVVGRFGGDEYMIYSEGLTSEAEAEELLFTLLERVHGVVLPDDQIAQLAFSMGAYLFDAPVTYEEAFVKADAALYRAKDQGRNQAVLINLQHEDVVIRGSVHT